MGASLGEFSMPLHNWLQGTKIPPTFQLLTLRRAAEKFSFAAATNGPVRYGAGWAETDADPSPRDGLGGKGASMRVNYAIIFVSDMKRAVSFYRDVLGIPLRFESPGWTEFATD